MIIVLNLTAGKYSCKNASLVLTFFFLNVLTVALSSKFHTDEKNETHVWTAPTLFSIYLDKGLTQTPGICSSSNYCE